MKISKALVQDIPHLVKLINSAYRGVSSKKGWTTEADMVSGDLRTNEANMKDLMQRPGVVFLKCCNDEQVIEGSVFLQKKDGKLYLGMLSVSPTLQTKGIGKKLMAAAEKYAREQDCTSVFMRVISIREELIAWYERQGYHKTGEVQPFENGLFGIAQQPLEFVVLQKEL